jgi:DNA replication protein DnaC
MAEPELLARVLMGPARPPKTVSEAEFARRRRERLFALRVPPKYAAAALDTIRLYGSSEQQHATAKMVRVARRLVGEYPEWLTTLVAFSGSVGTGKGHTCWAVARTLVEEHAAAVRFVELGDLVRDLRAAWNRDDLDERHELKYWRELDVLIINDVSRHAFRGVSMQHLFDVLEQRINFGRPTILTTNEPDEELHDILGRALWDRLTGFDGGLVDCGEESYRQLSTSERSVA